MSNPTLTVTKDFTKDFNAVIAQFKQDAVLVGIPETTTNRDDEEAGDDINNATILAINHFGSEAAHIPPRPVLTIGIRLAQPALIDQFRALARAVLTSGVDAFETYYNRVGSIAANSVKRVINDQTDIDPPSDATLKSRKYLTKSGFKGNKALVVSGQMRNAITYVVNMLGRL